jgi:Putative Actinobacterial Holin-X, holin superfamily III
MTDAESGRGRDQGPGAMMADVLAGVSRLVQGELALAPVVLGITAINVLAGAAVAAVVELGLAPIWAAVLVGVVLLLLALGFAQQAARLLREAGAKPRRSMTSVKRDVETLQTMVRRDATT